jgi:Ser/Thr protein kinase RdoA (MazF antagonist)
MVDPAALAAAAAWFSGPVNAAPLGAGHINDTWLVESPERGRFVLQRLSAAVFPRPREVAAKVARVTEHLRRSGHVAVPALLATAAGAAWHEDARGAVWRLWEFAAGTRTLGRLTRVAQGTAAGAAFGRFQLAVADLPGEVADPIPDFMRLSRYLAGLDAALAERQPDAGVEAALALVDPRRELADAFRDRDRLIHGDCKIDNLLFHEGRDEVACIIDLDTVMLGNWGWDFGDLVRSAAADGARVSVARFAAIAAGYVGSGALAQAGPERVDELVLAPRYVALMLGVRFLTDHLRGDGYFKVHARGENLARARRQLALLEDLERRERALRAAASRV